MPEGPELHLASRFVNNSCTGKIFAGNIIKSEVHKSEEIQFKSNAFTISAASRGKELQLFLSEVQDDRKSAKKAAADLESYTTILFRFGMSGKFEFTSEADLHKHAHLKFFTKSKPRMVLSYVDARRFGRFEETTRWGKGRGPDPMCEYQEFRLNVLKNLSSSEFDHPICEVLLNQKYFNGIGNYLRAEILYRLGIPPFNQAREVFENLSEIPPDVKPMVKGQMSKKMDQKADILHLCHSIPLEVVNLGGGGYDPEGNKTDYNDFKAWLQCYYQDGMKNMVDHNKRTIWFSGPAGPLIPKDRKPQTPTKRKNTKNRNDDDEKKKKGKPNKMKEGDKISTPKKKLQVNGVKTELSKGYPRKGNYVQQQEGTKKESKTMIPRTTKYNKRVTDNIKSKKQDRLSGKGHSGKRRSARLRENFTSLCG